ncbi:HAMP domain-containing sensor histidine kinase [Robiginitalea sp. SC105]|uniref:sensor histidine kinase n=1 Tax=Robiginitalea sp. SC105 TaxID=2762332 RepID=UPI00163A1064|nr:HAMP domain-containing sensor histidine kinase [Robiginitalea sp. SC105]MBC2840581.1 hypothetical protein [Robiginitalea sp. SC105]
MTTNSHGLLHQIAALRTSLEEFSFDQLSIEEAKSLKMRFESFRKQLEEKIWNPGSWETPDTDTNNGKDAHLLIASVSHEIQTPLNGIIGFSDLFAESGLNPQQQEFASAIRSAAHSMLEIINELQDYSRLRAGIENTVTIPFSPKQVLEEVAYLCRTLIVRKSVAFHAEIDPMLPGTLIGDPSELSKILMTLLGNAIKNVDKGNIALRVRSEVRMGICTLHGEVKDIGTGISESDTPGIINAFQQTSHPLQTRLPGHGLGLSIVKELIERQGGSIWVESEPGKGTCFVFRIPYPVDKMRVRPYAPDELHDKICRTIKNSQQPGTHQNKAAYTEGEADLLLLWEECKGDLGMLKDLMALLKNNLLEFLGRLRIHIPNGDFREIQAASRKVQEDLKLIRAGRWLEDVERIHRLSLQNRGLEEIASSHRELVLGYPQLERFMDQELEILRKRHGGS